MAIERETNSKCIVFWPEWRADDTPPNQAIAINIYDAEIGLTQGSDTVLIDQHELKQFIKLLQRIEKSNR